MLDNGGNGGGGDGRNQNVDAASAIPRIPMPRLSDSGQDLELYFTSLQFWFDACGVTNDAKKYSVVMAQIPLRELAQVQSELGAVPAHDKYEYIKPIIIAHFSDSREKRFREAINTVHLGDLEPSQLFAKIKQLAGDSLTEAALIDFWAAKLPEMAHAAVVQMKASPIKDRLVAADALVEAIRLRTITSVDINQATALTGSTPSTHNQPTTTNPIDKLCQQVAELQRNFSRINNERGRSRTRGQSRDGRERSTSRKEHPNCWYHYKYGADAKHCRTPCKFDEQNGASSSTRQNQ